MCTCVLAWLVGSEVVIMTGVIEQEANESSNVMFSYRLTSFMNLQLLINKSFDVFLFVIQPKWLNTFMYTNGTKPGQQTTS